MRLATRDLPRPRLAMSSSHVLTFESAECFCAQISQTVKSSLGNIGDEEAALEELQRTDKLKKLTDLLIKRNREQAFKIDTLLDKVSLISQELNKNARARGTLLSQARPYP